MCDQTEVSYEPDEVVWVKLGSVWWPAQVQDESKLSPDVTSGLKKKPLAVVKFMDEDTYEYPKSLDQIYRYNCLKKDEFIRKGLSMCRPTGNRDVSENMKKFPIDVSKAETLTGGNPDIIHDPKYLPEEKFDYRAHFGIKPQRHSKSNADKQKNAQKTPQRRTRVKFATPLSAPSTSRTPDIRITHTTKSFSNPVKRSRDKKRSITSAFKGTAVNKNNSQEWFVCNFCNFQCSRMGYMLEHYRAHYSGQINPIPPIIPQQYHDMFQESFIHKGRASSTPPAAPRSGSEKSVKRKKIMSNATPNKKQKHESPKDEKTHLRTPSTSYKAIPVAEVVGSEVAAPKKRWRKTKETKSVGSKKTEASDILKDWEDEIDEVDDINKTSAEGTMAVTPENNLERTELCLEPPQDNKSPAQKDKSCFDFEDNDESLSINKSLKFGQKLPRVISEEKTIKRRLLKQLQKESEETCFDRGPANEHFNEEIENLLKTTEVPKLPDIPQSNILNPDEISGKINSGKSTNDLEHDFETPSDPKTDSLDKPIKTMTEIETKPSTFQTPGEKNEGTLIDNSLSSECLRSDGTSTLSPVEMPQSEEERSSTTPTECNISLSDLPTDSEDVVEVTISENLIVSKTGCEEIKTDAASNVEETTDGVIPFVKDLQDKVMESHIQLDKDSSMSELSVNVNDKTDQLDTTNQHIVNQQGVEMVQNIPIPETTQPDQIHFDINSMPIFFDDNELEVTEGPIELSPNTDVIKIYLRNKGEELPEDFEKPNRILSLSPTRPSNSLKNIPTLTNKIVVNEKVAQSLLKIPMPTINNNPPRKLIFSLTDKIIDSNATSQNKLPTLNKLVTMNSNLSGQVPIKPGAIKQPIVAGKKGFPTTAKRWKPSQNTPSQAGMITNKTSLPGVHNTMQTLGNRTSGKNSMLITTSQLKKNVFPITPSGSKLLTVQKLINQADSSLPQKSIAQSSNAIINANRTLIKNKQTTPNILQKAPLKKTIRHLPITKSNVIAIQSPSQPRSDVAVSNMPIIRQKIAYLPVHNNKYSIQTSASSGTLNNLVVSIDTSQSLLKLSNKATSSAANTQSEDILAKALANTQVLQSESSDMDNDNTLGLDHEYLAPSLANNVLETSLTLNQPPIMSPLEVPSAITSQSKVSHAIPSNNVSKSDVQQPSMPLLSDDMEVPSQILFSNNSTSVPTNSGNITYQIVQDNRSLPDTSGKATDKFKNYHVAGKPKKKEESLLPEFLKGNFKKKSGNEAITKCSQR